MCRGTHNLFFLELDESSPCNYFEIFYYYPSIYVYLPSGRFPLGFSIKTIYVLVPRMCYMPRNYRNYFRVKIVLR